MAMTSSVASRDAVIDRLFLPGAPDVSELLSNMEIALYIRNLTNPEDVSRPLMDFVLFHIVEFINAAFNDGAPTMKCMGDAVADVKEAQEAATFSATTFLDPTGGVTSLHDPIVKHSTDCCHNGECAKKLSHLRKGDGNAIASEATSPDTEDDDARERRQKLLMCSLNAAELVYLFLSTTSPIAEQISTVVPPCLAALARPFVEDSSTVFLTAQRLLLAAFDNDANDTRVAISVALNTDLVRGIVENLSHSSVVAETLIALFGSALPASVIMDKRVDKRGFSTPWRSARFVEFLGEFLPHAIEDPSHYYYFYFLREILKRGYSQTAGPVVDALLEDQIFSPMLDTSLRMCEEEVHRSVPASYSATYTLSSEAISVMATVVSFLRKSLIVPETAAMYASTTDCIAPLLAIRQQARRLVGLLQHPNKGAAAIQPKDTLGQTRYSICELFTELTLYQLSTTDRTVVESGFLAAFLQLCASYHGHPTLALCLGRLVREVFNRPPLVGESVAEMSQRDLLIRHIVETEEAFRAPANAREGTPLSPMKGGALFSSLYHFATAKELHGTSVAAFSILLYDQLSFTALFDKANGGPLSHLLEPFHNDAALQERIADIVQPISGDGFQEPGSACTPVVKHHPVIRYVGSPTSVKSLSSGNMTASVSGGVAAGAAGGATTTRLQSPPLSAAAADGGVGTGPAAADGGSLWTSADGGDGLMGGTTPIEAAPVDLDAIAEEMTKLRAAGSPQIQAYPSFREMSLGFGSSGEEEEVLVTNDI